MGTFFGTYRKSSIKPSGGGLIYFKPILGGLLVTGAYLRGGLIYLEKTMMSVLHKELEYKVEELK